MYADYARCHTLVKDFSSIIRLWSIVTAARSEAAPGLMRVKIRRGLRSAAEARFQATRSSAKASRSRMEGSSFMV